MPKRSSNDDEDDVNSLAARIVAQSTGEKAPKHRKNPHAVALGRKGGKVGGKARAAKLSPEKRKQIARAAARARWKK